MGKKTKVKRSSSPRTSQTSESPVTAILKFLWEPVNLLSDNEKRHIEILDIARGFGLVYMIVFHSFMVLGAPEVHADSIWSVINSSMWFQHTMVAFHILIGLYVVYTQPTTQKLLLRGVQVFFLGLLLNLVRFLPVIVGVAIGSFNMDDFAPYNNLGDIIFHVDIYLYAGLALLAFALLRKIMGTVVRPVYWLLMIVVVLALTPSLVGLETGVIYIDRFLDILWGFGGKPHIWFPFFPYFSYSLLGAMVGCLLLKVRNWENMEEKFTKATFIVFSLGVFLADILRSPIGREILFFLPPHVRPEIFIRSVGVIMVLITLFLWLYRYFPRNIILKTFSYWSKNIMLFYCIQWVILGWIASLYFQAFRQQSIAEVGVVIIVVLVLAHFFTRFIAGPIPEIYSNVGESKERV